MTHPIVELQSVIVNKLNTDMPLNTLIGPNAIFDMPPKGKSGSYIVVGRHDLIVRDADIAPGNDHRVQFRAWVPEANRSAALALADRVTQVLTVENLSGATLKVTHVQHMRTDTAIELKTGRAFALVSFRFLSEPNI